MTGRRTAVAWTVLAVAFSGCATVPEKGGFSDVADLVEERIAHRVHWFQGTPEDAEVAAEVRALLAGQLSLDEAVQIALLNNRGLQAEYEELGISQADLVQAGLLRNPVFFASARFPDQPPSAANLEFEIVQDFLDLLLRPVRKKLAGIELEEAKLRVSAAVIDLAAAVKAAHVTLQGRLQITSMLELIARAASNGFEFARRQHAAGNLNDLDLASRQGLYEQAKLDLARSEAEVMVAREDLNRLLGLWGTDVGWEIAGELPELPAEEVPLERLESLALARRLDLAAERLEVEKLAQALDVEVKWRWVMAAEVGVSSEREPDGQTVTGPNLMIQLPIFDQGQARIARFEALLRQSQQRLAQMALEVRSEVRAVRNRLLAGRRTAEHYRDVLIPVRERIVAESQRHYNFMLIGVYRLLEAKQDEIDAYREYVEAVRDYWLARIDLERAVGGRLTAEDPADPPRLSTPISGR